MSTPLNIRGISYRTGLKIVAVLLLPAGLSTAAGTTIAGGSVSGTTTVSTSSTVIYLGLSETPAGSGSYSANSTIGGAGLPDTVGLPYLIEARVVDSATDMTSYAAIAAAYAASSTIAWTEDVVSTIGGGALASGVWGVNTVQVAGAAAPNFNGTGADQCTLHFESNGLPVADADVWITSDSAGTNRVAGALQTNSSGNVTFLLDAGSTYYVWMQKDGQNSIRGQAYVAVAD
jgi:hypothetical protein